MFENKSETYEQLKGFSGNFACTKFCSGKAQIKIQLHTLPSASIWDFKVGTFDYDFQISVVNSNSIRKIFT